MKRGNGHSETVVLVLDAAAWGRVALALDIAYELHNEGDEVVFVTHTTTAPLLTGKVFQPQARTFSLLSWMVLASHR